MVVKKLEICELGVGICEKRNKWHLRIKCLKEEKWV